jgi:hypothetical protein
MNRFKLFSRLILLIPFGVALALLVIAGPIGGCSNSSSKSPAPQPQADAQKTFASPDEAVAAMLAAVRSMDEAQLKAVFGAEGDDLLASGDSVADRQTADRFLRLYDEKHELTTNPDGSMTLNVGKDDWPLPIPLVRDDDGKRWLFDTAAGKEEIINRRIGRNELDVIQVCKAIGDAQAEYTARDPMGVGIPVYAKKFISDPGQKNGLFWPTAEGEPPSPLGPLAADAAAEGYSTAPRENDEPHPYHGYYYRILTAQGPSAPGGALDYLVDGKLVGGFAVVAWPSDYGNSGIMTFLVNYQGVVYQKDLGDDTDKLARAMKAYDPDASWKKSE